MKKFVYKVWDDDNLVVLKYELNERGLPFRCMRKIKGGKEVCLSDIDPEFSSKCFIEGREVSEDFYKNYK